MQCQVFKVLRISSKQYCIVSCRFIYYREYSVPYLCWVAAFTEQHTSSVHKDERDIIHLKNIKDRERHEKLAYLLSLGSPNSPTPFKEKDEPGGLQVRYKPKTKSESFSLDYRECPGCRGMYCKTTLWKHQRRCFYAHPPKKEQLNPRNLPLIRSKLPAQQKNC